MFSAIKTLNEPASLTGCITARLSPFDPNDHLVILRTNYLDIYNVTSGRLQLVSKHRFYDKIISIQAIPSPSHAASQGQDSPLVYDRLMLSFLDAKVAIMEWDFRIRELINVALYTFENQTEMINQLQSVDQIPYPQIDVEPEKRRFAIVRLFSSFCTIISLGSPQENEGLDGILDSPNLALAELKSGLAVESTLSGEEHDLYPTFECNFSSMDSRISGRIKHVKFLYEFLEPTIAILHEALPTFNNRLEERMDTFQLTIVSFDFLKKKFRTISHIDALPSDSDQLVPLPKMHGGGVLLVTANSIIHLITGINPYGIAVNGFAEMSSSFRYIQTSYGSALGGDPKKAIVVDDGLVGCATCLTGNAGILLSTMNKGRLFSLSIDRTRKLFTLNEVSVNDLEGEPNQLIGPSIFCDLGRDDLVFFASSFSDSLLIQTKQSSLAVNAETSSLHTTAKHLQQSDDIEDDLYGTNTASKSLISELKANVLDKILCTTPVSGFAMSTKMGECIFPSGAGNGSMINIVFDKIPLQTLGSLHIPSIQAMWVLGNAERRYILASTMYSSLLLEQTLEGGLAEVETSPFYLEGRTLFACYVEEYAMFLQFHTNGIRTLSSNFLEITEFIEFPLDASTAVVQKIEYNSGYLFALLSTGSLLSFFVDPTGVRPYDFSDSKFKHFSLSTITDHGVSVLLIAKGLTKFSSGTSSAHDLLSIVSLKTGSVIFQSSAFVKLPPCVFNDENGVNTNFNDRQEDTIKDILMACVHELNWIFVLTTDNMLYTYKLCTISPMTNELAIYNLPLTARHLNGALRLVRLNDGCNICVLGSDPIFIHIGLNKRFPVFHRIGDSFDSIERLGDSIIFISKESLNIASAIEKLYTLDKDFPIIRKPLGIPNHHIEHITYHEPSDTFLCSLATDFEFNLPKDEFAPLTDNPSFTYKSSIPKTAIQGPASAEYSIGLISPISWTVIDRYQFENHVNEHITCLESICLETKATASGKKDFCVVGTASVKTEDRPTRGRILIFDIISVVPQEGRPETNRKIRLLKNEQMRGPVTALASINGYLLVALGTKIIIHSFEDNESLNGIAFFDIGTYINSVAVVKNFFIISDIFSTVSLLVFQEDPPKIIHLSKNFSHRIFCNLAEFAVYDQELMIVAADAFNALHFYQYQPDGNQVNCGDTLNYRGSISTFTKVTNMKKFKHARGLGIILTTLDGATWLISGMPQTCFQKLFALSYRLCGQTPPYGGLHARQARTPKKWLSGNFESQNTSITKDTFVYKNFDFEPAQKLIDWDLCSEFWTNPRLVYADLVTSSQQYENNDEYVLAVSGALARYSLAKSMDLNLDDLRTSKTTVEEAFDWVLDY